MSNTIGWRNTMNKIKQAFQTCWNLFFSRDFFCFVVIGVINTFNGTLLSALFSIFLNANLAFIIGYLCSLSIAYLLNSFFTFHEKLHWQKYFKFCLSYVPNFIIQNLVVLLVYNVLGFHKIIAYLVAAILGIPITFLLTKFFAFGRKR